MTPQIEVLKNLIGDLFARLMAFTLEEEFFDDLGEALEVFYNLQEGEEYEFDPAEEFLFLSWFLLDDVDARGQSFMDLFLSRNADDLSIHETQICHALKDTHLSLLQVLKVTPAKSIVLKDIFLGQQFEVNESAVTDESMVDHLLFTRVLSLGDTRFLVGAGVFIDPCAMESLTTFITDQFKFDCEEGQPQSFKEFLKYNGELINWWIRSYEKGELFEDSSMPDQNIKSPKKPDDSSPSGSS